MKTVTLIVPVHNEAEGLGLFFRTVREEIDKLPAYRWEFLFVDDGSTDGSLTLLREFRAADARAHYLSLARNFGKEAALLAGLDAAGGDAVILLDADLQDPPELFGEMLREWEAGHDDVYAQRISRGRESRLRALFSAGFYKLLQSSAGIDMLPNVGDFRLLDRRCVEALRQLRETERYTKGLYCWIGFRKQRIVFHRGDRAAGKSSWNYWRLFNLALDGLTSFTTSPLRLAIFLGLFCSGFAFCYGCWEIFKTLMWGDVVRGYPTLLTVILFLGGVQLFSLGVIGEYLGRIFLETKRRPVYLVAERDGKSGGRSGAAEPEPLTTERP